MTAVSHQNPNAFYEWKWADSGLTKCRGGTDEIQQEKGKNIYTSDNRWLRSDMRSSHPFGTCDWCNTLRILYGNYAAASHFGMCGTYDDRHCDVSLQSICGPNKTDDSYWNWCPLVHICRGQVLVLLQNPLRHIIRLQSKIRITIDTHTDDGLTRISIKTLDSRPQRFSSNALPHRLPGKKVGN